MTNKLSCLYGNSGSMGNVQYMLQVLMHEYNYKLVGVTETQGAP